MTKLKRGIILSNTNGMIFGNNPKLLEPELTKIDLMNLALYWDQINLSFGIVRKAIEGEESFIKEGILQYKHARLGFSGIFNEINFHKNNLEALIKCYEESRRDKTVDWTMYHRVNSPFYENYDVVKKNTIRVKLNSLLPIPSKFVTADQILEFKEKNQKSLQNLHNYIFDIFLRISNIQDPDLRSIYEIQLFNEFEEALADYKGAFKSKFKNPQFMTLTADVNIKNSLLDVGQMILDQSMTIKGAIDLSKNFLTIFSTKQNIPKAVSNNTTFHYIGEAIQHGLISQF
ncbi:DUF6236 family protein [Acinetobacter baumannii]|nr:DUF6236 family protein [Acinetobacter baumannii]